jgi:hypothetical protein
MLPTELAELRAKRELLFKQLQEHPQRLHLAIDIKLLDDQIAESHQKIQADKKARK